jgi:hypothetical protein
MRRSRSFRLFAALFAPWFAVVVAEPVPMHDCPQHSLRAAAAHTMAASHGTSAGERGTSSLQHSGMEQSNSGRGHDATGQAAHHQCCCIGTCCAAAPASVARAEPLAWVPATLRSETLSGPAEWFAPTAAPHTLPFANGPPAARA